MIQIIIYVIGSFIALTFPKEIVKLGYLTMDIPFDDDNRSFFYSQDESKISCLIYMFFVALFSWLSVVVIYFITIFIIIINTYFKNDKN